MINSDMSNDQIDDRVKLIFEQYKICIEMADQISSRRATANAFFLTLNSSIISLAVGAITNNAFTVSLYNLLYVTVVGITLCYIWYRLIKSYRQLNSAKFKVIGQLEKELPAQPFSTGEWKMLGEGNDRSLYTPLSGIENFVPLVFATIYVSLTLLVI